MMSISVNGQSKVPPGFRFHPTEEELLLYYLRKKVSFEPIDLDVIQDVDLNKLEPWDIQEKCKIGSTPQNDWYFFSHKDKKYPTGTRTNRATFSGFWKATGRDKVIYSNSNKIGMRKTLVFYKGRAPHGLKSDWIMHEYRLDNNEGNSNDSQTSNVLIYDVAGEMTQEESWVVCRVFRKKNHYKTLDDDSPSSTTEPQTRIPAMLNPTNKGTSLEETLEYIVERNFNEQYNGTQFPSLVDSIMSDRFTQQHLPSLDSPNSNNSVVEGQTCYQPIHHLQMINNQVMSSGEDTNMGDLEHLVSSHLNGGAVQNETPRQQFVNNDPNNLIYCCYPAPSLAAIHDLQTQQLQSLSASSSAEKLYLHCHQDYTSQLDLWTIERSL